LAPIKRSQAGLYMSHRNAFIKCRQRCGLIEHLAMLRSSDNGVLED
jgi:hypothetical protein